MIRTFPTSFELQPLGEPPIVERQMKGSAKAGQRQGLGIAPTESKPAPAINAGPSAEFGLKPRESLLQTVDETLVAEQRRARFVFLASDQVPKAIGDRGSIGVAIPLLQPLTPNRGGTEHRNGVLTTQFRLEPLGLIEGGHDDQIHQPHIDRIEMLTLLGQQIEAPL